MTHFIVGIIVPKGRSNVPGYIAEKMAPYQEHSNAEPYVCYTLEQAATELRDSIRRFELIISREEPGYELAKCRERLNQLRAMTPEQKYQEVVQFHENFNERGEPLSTYNPDSKWDWYVIGGRWDGWINDKETSAESIRDNSTTTEKAIARDLLPHAILTPDGKWHERGRVGWFGILITENENWSDEAKSILTSYPGHRLVIVDAHI